ncbi:MAG: hypothetical protein ACT4P3_17385 [Betaproteobacteria bacterium]
MRRLVLLFALVLSACGVEQHSIDDGIAWGTVLSVEEAPRADLAELTQAYDHLLVPEVAWKIVVRTDCGYAITVRQDGERRYEPGERVRVLIDDAGALLL